MENQNTKDKTFEKFTWKIENFSKLDSKRLYSENFSIDGHTWRILILPKGLNVDYLSIFLDAGNKASLPSGWSKHADFKLNLVNQVNGKNTIFNESEHEFNAREIDWGFPRFIPLKELFDSNKGFLVNDTCIVEAEIAVNKSKHENQVDEPENKMDVPPVIPEQEMSMVSFGELMNFKDLGKVEKDFIPLLEEVCSRHPSLIDSQKKRSQRFTEWAFTALGRVLHFLKTKKVKDMNDDACHQLKVLWEELETIGFDLSWLQPHVRYALSLTHYVEKDTKVRKMKEDMAALKMKMKSLKAETFAAEVDFEIVRRDLVKEGFEERDLDAELGYGGMS